MARGLGAFAPLLRLRLTLPAACTYLGPDFGVALAAFPGLQVWVCLSARHA